MEGSYLRPAPELIKLSGLTIGSQPYDRWPEDDHEQVCQRVHASSIRLCKWQGKGAGEVRLCTFVQSKKARTRIVAST